MATFEPTNVDLHELAEECCEISHANGFERADFDNAVHKIAFVFTELDEARDAVRGTGEDPLGEELADIAIRLFDLLNGIAGETWHDRTRELAVDEKRQFNAIEVLLAPIAEQCAKALEDWRRKKLNDLICRLELALKETARLAQSLDIDLVSEVLAKNRKNRERPHLHGKATTKG